MPKVGNKMFSYDKKGKMEAKEYAKKIMGSMPSVKSMVTQPIKNVVTSAVKAGMSTAKPKGRTITELLKSRKMK